MGKSSIVAPQGLALSTLLERANAPCVCTGLPSASWCLFRCRWPWELTCCRRRVQITRLFVDGEPAGGPEVNRFVKTWLYYVTEVAQTSRSAVAQEGCDCESGGVKASGSDSRGEPVELRLFLDPSGRYPAVLDAADGPPTAESAGVRQPQRIVTGCLEINKSSPLSWAVASILAMVFVVFAVWGFVETISNGVATFQGSLSIYQKGIQDAVVHAQQLLPEDALVHVNAQVDAFMQNGLPELAQAMVHTIESISFQAILFVIYLFFWISEPLPVSASVAQVFKSYLFLKTVVSLLFAGLMSLLLLSLGCPLWHLFFVITFLLNYIPEVGPLMVAMMCVPAILFDGSLSFETRQVNTVWLMIFGMLFKVVTGNIIEVKLYSSLGGQFMRMHPVVLVALMMLCEALLGISGMFLSIPIMSAVKYYIVTTDMPDVFLNPLLVLIEGDEAGAHKNFVDRYRALNGDKLEARAEEVTDCAGRTKTGQELVGHSVSSQSTLHPI